jgi:NADP-dependent 3-hydroxy acid dehydrogenase YdfG
MKVLVIGASGLVGGAAASALSTDGIEVLRASRSADLKVDVTDPESVRQLFVTVGMVDAVVVAVGSVPFKPLRDLGRDDFAAAFYGKVQAQVDVVQIGMDYVVDAPVLRRRWRTGRWSLSCWRRRPRRHAASGSMR